MRKTSTATAAVILAVSLYFAFVWSYEAVHIFISPSYGLDDAWRGDYIFVLGHLLGFGPTGLIKLAAFFGAAKAVAAIACGLLVADRVYRLIVGGANSEVLEGGLLLALLLNLIAAATALWVGYGGGMREYALQLAIASLAAALCISQRRRAEDKVQFGDAETVRDAQLADEGGSASPRIQIS